MRDGCMERVCDATRTPGTELSRASWFSPATHPFHHAPTRRVLSILVSFARLHTRFSHPKSLPVMKPPMQEELEDDLAAEEENKLINEVFKPSPHTRLR